VAEQQAQPAKPGSRVEDRPSRNVTQRQAGGPLGDRRGLTAAGIVVMLFAFGFIGALIDLLFGKNLWVFFGILFIGSAALSAARCHAEDLAAAIVIPPLIYAVIAFIFTVISPRSGTHEGGIRQFAIDYGGEIVFSAPLLLAATLVALFIATSRGRANAAKRRKRQQARPRSA
jgi:hypothetical protein